MPASATSSLFRLGLFLAIALLALFVVPVWMMGDEPEKHRAVFAAEISRGMMDTAALKTRIAEFYDRYREFPLDMDDLEVPADEQAYYESRGILLAEEGVIHLRLRDRKGRDTASVSLSPALSHPRDPPRWQCTSTFDLGGYLPQCERRARSPGQGG